MNSQVIRSLETTKALTEQFILSLSSPPLESATSQETQSPLPLLSASAQALHSQTAKVSLLAINSPFTPSAVIAVLSDLDGSVLPSFVTAALLIRSEYHTNTFHSETNALVKSTFRELQVLLDEVKVIALANGKDLREEQKSVVTTTTGRVWKACDQLVTLSKEGVLGLVIQKVRQYLELVRDGIRELREWDPAEESDDDEDGFGRNDDDDGDAHGSSIRDACNGAENEDCDDALWYEEARDGKKQILRVLNPVAQIYPTIISHLLEGITEWSPTYVPRIETLVSCLQDIPDLTDEAAGSLYETNIKGAGEYVQRLLDRAIAAVATTRDLLDSQAEYKKRTVSDKFSKWASVWLAVAEEMRKSHSTTGNNSAR